MTESRKNIAVVGGGAAGLAAAIHAARKGADVTVYEKNKYPAKKLRITGKGRCNVCNDCTPEEVLGAVTKNSKFLYSSVFSFPPAQVKQFFEDLGVPLKTERGRRVFPVSDKASDISDALIAEAKRLGVRFFHSRIKSLEAKNGEITGLRDENGFHPCGAVILATGGVSYPATGSTGDGHRMAEALGIEVTPLSPSLVPIVCRENTAEMMGLTLKNVCFSVYRNQKPVFSEQGELLFTHFGISGPLALSASAHMQDYPVGKYSAQIDLKPALDADMLDKRLQSDLKKYSAKDFINSLGDLLPKSLIPSVVRLSGIPEHTKCAEITREMRKNLGEVLKHYPLSPTAFRSLDEAIITRGGVSVREISPSTMMCKKVSGLFFAGEIIDTDAYTGGYNLQIAWSTGRKAGISAAEYVSDTSERI
ncbi:MAG: aminoacetone oxidase family FAD-binding enzyme [Clostridia bacterium]|nr:aminoacetone oxidase family FAD-binding enzyme [Clostridia bacterium]